MLRLARLSEWEKLRREVHRAREAGQEGSSISSRQAVVEEPRPIVTTSDDPSPTSVGEAISSPPRDGGEGVTRGDEDAGEELLSRDGASGEALMGTVVGTGSSQVGPTVEHEEEEERRGNAAATAPTSLPLRRVRSPSAGSFSRRSRRRQATPPAHNVIVTPTPPSSNSPSPISLFSVRPSRERRAWPATVGLLPVTTRTPRPSAESSVRPRSSRPSLRRRRRPFQGRGGLRLLTPADDGEASESVADDGGYRDVLRLVASREAGSAARAWCG